MIKVRYLSKLGHTKDIANAIAEGIGVKAISITDEPKLLNHTDVLVLGGAPYANIMAKELKEYVLNLDKSMVDRVILFTTSNWSRRTVKAIKKMLNEKDINYDDKYFYSHMLKIKKGTVRAKQFGEAIKQKYDNKVYNYFGSNVDIKDELGLSPNDYYDLLKHIWSKDTCALRMQDKWSKDNYTVGQCSITSFLIQDIYGGEVFGIPLGDGNYHCFNVIGDLMFDLTSEQFSEPLDYENNIVLQKREEHFKKEEKYNRYLKLKEELNKALGK